MTAAYHRRFGLRSDGSHTNWGGGKDKKAPTAEAAGAQGNRGRNLELEHRRQLDAARPPASDERIADTHVAGRRDDTG